jgi:hypothetical protein
MYFSFTKGIFYYVLLTPGCFVMLSSVDLKKRDSGINKKKCYTIKPCFNIAICKVRFDIIMHLTIYQFKLYQKWVKSLNLCHVQDSKGWKLIMWVWNKIKLHNCYKFELLMEKSKGDILKRGDITRVHCTSKICYQGMGIFI